MRKISRLLRDRLPILLLGGALAVGGSAAALASKSAAKDKPEQPTITIPMDENPVSRDAGPRGSFAPVVKKVTPGVVKVVTTPTLKKASAQNGMGFEVPFWRRFFGEEFGGRGPGRQFAPPRQQGLGSGVIVSKDGYILTNNHVVDGAEEVKVTMQDGREFTAKVIGRDPKSDIAVIKVDGSDLPFVPMADSDNVQVGDIVLAIGNPFGVGQTVTTGIVSATGRGNLGLDYEDFIQTDAAINPGNSGGALVDIEGRLIGINTAMLSHSGGSQGIGFAIPSDLAKNVMQSLVKYGHVTRGYLGVMIQDLTPALASQFELKDTKGALVGDVVAKGPADQAGFKSGDVVLAFNGKAIADSRHLKLEVAQTKPGSTVPVKVMRDGSTKTLEVKVKALPGSENLAKADSQDDGDNGTLNGVGVADLNQKTRQEMNVPENVKGVVVTEVQPDSAAAEAGIKPGDVIQEINRRPVASTEEAIRLTEKAKDKHTMLRVWSNGGSRYVVVDESKAG